MFSEHISVGPRVGIDNTGEASALLGVSGSLEIHLYPDTKKQLPRNEAVVKM